MKVEDERTKLFNEVWDKPVTTVAQRYGLSDNGLRKRCIKLNIPLPPIGYWAKLKAGLEVPPKPKLPPLKTKPQITVFKDTKQDLELEFIDINIQSTEELKNSNGFSVLSLHSQKEFEKWCSKITVPKKVDLYHPLIIEYQKELEYRLARDKEHKFRDYFRYSEFSLRNHTNVEYRKDALVLPIYVSDKQSHRAYRIVDALIRLIEVLNGKLVVEKYYNRHEEPRDNATINIFNKSFTFQVRELMNKRRTVHSDTSDENKKREMKPMYEKVFTGILEIELKHSPDYRDKDKAGRTLVFQDSPEAPLENQVGQIIKALFIVAQEIRIAQIINIREEETKENELMRLREIEEEKQREKQKLLEIQKRQKQLIDNIEQQMGDWYKAQKLRQYADKIEVYAQTIDDPEAKASLDKYVVLVREKAGKCDPIIGIISEIKAIGIKKD